MGAVSKYVRIAAPPQQVYDLWRDPTHFPDFMPDVQEVTAQGDSWHWKVDSIAGTSVEWDSEVVEDLPGQRLAWKSVGGDVENSGAVRFDDRDGQTGLEFAMEFDPPAGVAGEVLAKLFKDPEDQLQRSLDAFKELVEKQARPRDDARTEVDAAEAHPPQGEVV